MSQTNSKRYDYRYGTKFMELGFNLSGLQIYSTSFDFVSLPITKIQ